MKSLLFTDFSQSGNEEKAVPTLVEYDKEECTIVFLNDGSQDAFDTIGIVIPTEDLIEIGNAAVKYLKSCKKVKIDE